MALTVGHNDCGYLPLDGDVLEVDSLDEALAVLGSQVESWFGIEVDAEEMTIAELNMLKRRAMAAQRNSALIIRGHAFWIM